MTLDLLKTEINVLTEAIQDYIDDSFQFTEFEDNKKTKYKQEVKRKKDNKVLSKVSSNKEHDKVSLSCNSAEFKLIKISTEKYIEKVSLDLIPYADIEEKHIKLNALESLYSKLGSKKEIIIMKKFFD